MADERRRERILELARAVPEGFVTSYGDLSPEAPRLAGAVLAGCSDPRVPWHRVVRADGTPTQGERQRRLLEREGVPFRGGRVEVELANVPHEGLVELAALAAGDRRGGGESGREGR